MAVDAHIAHEADLTRVSLPLRGQIVVATGYTAAALALALVLPQQLPGWNTAFTGLISALVWFGCLAAHQIFLYLRLQQRFTEETARQQEALGQVMGELNGARSQVRLIQEALEAAAEKRDKAAQKEIREVVDEVRMLKRLVEQVSAGRSGAEGLPPPIARGLDDDALLATVRDALKADRVDLYLQPIVTLPQRKRRYFECFSRIRTEDGRMITPAQYIHVAEDAGLVSSIDNLLLFRCVQLVRRTRSRRFDFAFFCNISRHTLGDAEFFADFVQFMRSNEDLAANLHFEFAQADFAGLGPEVQAALDRLADHGFRYSLDQVREFEIDAPSLARRHVAFVKLDSLALVDRIREDAYDLRSLKRRLQAYGISLVVEKVEEEQTLVELLDHEVEFGQGYLFGEPRISRDG